MTRETLEHMARDLATEITLPAEDWEAAVTQAAAMLSWLKTLDELMSLPLDEEPLHDLEPATTSPSPPRGEGRKQLP